MTISSSSSFGVEPAGKTVLRNVLFLDFDGVCNSFKRGSYLTHEPEGYGFDPEIIERIREICSNGRAEIVISSNWRRFEQDGHWVYNGKNYKNPLPSLYSELGDLIVGELTTEKYLTKSEAIELWFEDNDGFRGKFAIVDDDPREGIQNNFKLRKGFWPTTPKFGLTEKIKKEIIDHLEEN